MRAVRRRYKQIYSVLHAKRYNFGSYVAGMPDNDQHRPSGRIRRAPPATGLKYLGGPLAAVTITCPTTFASGEAPVGWHIVRSPGCEQMFGLEDQERRTHETGGVHHLHRGYPLWPALYLLPATLIANVD
jgi:hypothetical protein